MLSTVRLFSERCWNRAETLITKISINESWCLQKGMKWWKNSIRWCRCRGSWIFIIKHNSIRDHSETSAAKCHTCLVIIQWHVKGAAACWRVSVAILQEQNVRQTHLMGSVVCTERWVMPSGVCWRSTSRSQQSAWKETTMMSSCSGKQME